MLPKKFLLQINLITFIFLFSCGGDKEFHENNPKNNSSRGQNYQAPAPYYQANRYPAPQYYQAPVPQYGRPPQIPGSRYYSNPYDVPPAQYYPQQYDADQYYVMPNSYQNIERQQPIFENNGSSPF